MEARSPEYLTVAEAAALLRVSRKTIEAAARRGELPSECVGRQRRFLRRALDAHFSRYSDAGTDPAASWPQGQATTKPAPVRATAHRPADWARRALQESPTRYSERTEKGAKTMDQPVTSQTWKAR